MEVQLDIFKDYGYKPCLLRVWFSGRVFRETSPHHDKTWSYRMKATYKPGPSSYSGGAAGPCESYESGVAHIMEWCERILARMPKTTTDKETMDAYAEQRALGHIIHRMDRDVNYSLTINGTEIIPCTRWQGFLDEVEDHE